ncbi:MAG: hypothetical protein LBN08_05340 [Lactobacillales bacterium]|jgi:transglutaminase/protease-like cytokinesis protein 3|nr:hypothetical protein [Lactobacillales bacterium]
MKKILVACFLLLALTGCGTTQKQAKTIKNPVPTYAPIDTTISYYAYSELSSSEQVLYARMLDAINNYQAKITSVDGSVSVDEAFKVANYIMLEHPEIYYFTGGCNVKYDDEGVHELDLTYDLDKNTTKNNLAQIDSIASDFASKNAYATDYEKALAIFNYLAENVTYDEAFADASKADTTESAPYNPSTSIEGVFLNHTAICSGYAQAFELLAHRLGIEAVSVTGTGKSGEGHEWVLAKLDGEYYYIDPTWGDQDTWIDYSYFAMTSDQLNKEHTTDETLLNYPVAESNADDYFVKNNIMFTEYNLDNFKQGFTQVRYSTPEAYALAKEHLFNRQEIFKLTKSSKAQTVSNDNYLTIKIFEEN